MKNRRTIGGSIVLVGILLCLLTLFADAIGLGSETTTFSWKQWLSLSSGIFLCVIGSIIVFYRFTKHYAVLFWKHRFAESTRTYVWVHRRQIVEGGVLSIVLIAAAAVRIIHSHFGLPYLHIWDEPQTTSTALRMLRSGEYNPNFFNYGSLTIYLSLIVDILHYFYLMSQATGSSVLRDLNDIQINVDTGFHWTISHPSFYLWNRWLIAGMGTISVGITYYLAKRIGGILAGVVAAVFLAGLLIHVQHSTRNTPDLPVSFFVLCTVACLVLFFERNRPIYFLLALTCAGFAASVKYNSVIVLVLPLTSLVYAWRMQHQGYRRWLWFTLPIIPVLAFFLGTPYALIDLEKFLSQAGFEVYHYRTAGHDWYATVEPGWLHAQLQLSNFYTNLGIIGTIGCVIGLVYLATRWYGRLFLLYLIITFIVLTRTTASFHRNFIVFYPFFAIAIGCSAGFLYQAVCRLMRQRSIWQQRATSTLLLLVVTGATMYWLSTALQQSWKTGMVSESRSQAIDYVQRLVQDNSRSDVKVGIASELRVHSSDLQRLGVRSEVAPYQQLICHPDDYTYILGPSSDGRMQHYFNAHTTHHTIIGNGPVNPAGPLVNPAVAIIAPDPTSSVLPYLCSQTISPEAMQYTPNYSISNGKLAMWWNGEARTPRFDIAPGTYIFGWHAFGHSAGGQFARLKATVLVYESQEEAPTVLAESVYELTPDLHPYSLAFTLDEHKQIVLQLEFLNDGTDTSGNDRNAFIGTIRLASINQPFPLDLLAGEDLDQADDVQPYVVENGSLKMHAKAAVETPHAPLTAGNYSFSWDARGELFNDAYSKIQVQIIEMQNGKSSTVPVEDVIELSANMQSYSLPFSLSEDSAVMLRIASVNDAASVELGQGHNVYLSNIRVSHMPETVTLNTDMSEQGEKANGDVFRIASSEAVQIPFLPLNAGLYEWQWYARSTADTSAVTHLRVTPLILEGDITKTGQDYLIEIKPYFHKYAIPSYLQDSQSVALRFVPEIHTNTAEAVQDYTIEIGFVHMQQTSNIPLTSLSIEPYYYIDKQGLHMTNSGKITTGSFEVLPGHYRFLWSTMATNLPVESETLLLRETLVEHAANGDMQVRKERVLMIPPGNFPGYFVIPFTTHEPSRISLQLEFINGAVLDDPNHRREIIVKEVRFEQTP